MDRAKEQLDSIKYLAKDAVRGTYSIETKIDAQYGHRVLYYANVIDLPCRYSILIGEFMHVCRSLLDNLVWQLIINHSNTPPDPKKKPEFPILCDTNGMTLETCAVEVRRKVQGTDPALIAVFERLQPYTATCDHLHHPLWRLYTLNILDKHRLVPFLGGYRRTFSATWPDGWFVGGSPLVEEGANAATLPALEPDEVDVEPYLGIEPAFGKECGFLYGWPVIEVCESITRYIHYNILPAFRPAFMWL